MFLPMLVLAIQTLPDSSYVSPQDRVGDEVPVHDQGVGAYHDAPHDLAVHADNAVVADHDLVAQHRTGPDHASIPHDQAAGWMNHRTSLDHTAFAERHHVAVDDGPGVDAPVVRAGSGGHEGFQPGVEVAQLVERAR